ncbi:MAG: aldehyde dehydrogenase family protein [Acidobacteriota bacterium]
MLKESYPCFLGNKAFCPNKDLEVTDKYTGKVVTRVPLADKKTINRAIELAENSKEKVSKMPSFKRQEILYHCIDRFKERFDELALALCIEAGKPIKDSRGEVTRLIDTFRVAAEESVRITGEVFPMDISSRAGGYRGMWKRVPIGVCSFISPFNFPLNLVAHKIAPAIAAGNPFILKPATKTPVGALIIGEILAEAGLPEGSFSILPVRRDGAALFTEDERIKLLSFTGSSDVGWSLKSKAGKKKVVLELGGNAACVVDEDSDLKDAVERIVFGAFYQSGQSCVSVQRIIVQENIYEKFKILLTEAVVSLKSGDPKDESVFIGPMISENEATRLKKWIDSAVYSGGKLLCGGGLRGSILEATLLENVPFEADVYTKEAFGPVAVLSKFKDFDKALKEINNSVYGLQAGIFTRDIHKANKAWDTLDVGGVIIGDVPSFRVDHMPYGGVKNSGLGREGVRFAIEDMTEIRLMVIRDL